MMFCLEDCKVEGIIFVYFVCDNINISVRCKYVFGGCVINNGWEENNVDYYICLFNIKMLGVEQLIMNFLGGNQ